MRYFKLPNKSTVVYRKDVSGRMWVREDKGWRALSFSSANYVSWHGKEISKKEAFIEVL